MSSALLTIDAQRVDGIVRKLELDPHRRITRDEVGKRCNPPVRRFRVTAYHELAVSYVPGYDSRFYVYDREGKKVINWRLGIPETHLPVLQRIREQFEKEKNEAAVVQWLSNPENQQELGELLSHESDESK